MSSSQWQFPAHFRRNAFGWRDQVPRQRIKEAITEIRKVARKEPIVAAEGAILFLEKISPALAGVDSSSGALGGAVNHAIEILTPIISKAMVSEEERQVWLERLWEALQVDNIPYIEYLGDFWGELCVTPTLASPWADYFIDTLIQMWSDKTAHGYFKGTTACFSALLAAHRYQELLALLDKAPFKWWYDRRWGVKALVALGRPEDALHYAEDSKGLNSPRVDIARTCEEILLSMGLAEEAYQRYAVEANETTTNLATFRAIAKKYSQKPAIDILHDLIASQPGSEGKWFAAAKEAGFYELAIELVGRTPTDPKTLARAAKEYADKNPTFAIASGMASLRWISEGYGYEISGGDVLGAYSSILQAANHVGIDAEQIKRQIGEMRLAEKPNGRFVNDALLKYLDRGIL
jgi:hypothetical protein